jgi:hypothetical protein
MDWGGLFLKLQGVYNKKFSIKIELNEEIKMKNNRIFSGEYSRKMWNAINNARTKRELRGAFYFVCCRLQELESLLCQDEEFERKIIKQHNRLKLDKNKRFVLL